MTTATATTIATPDLLDTRLLPPARRHEHVMATFDALPVGGAFELVADHDPLPLYRQFERTRLGAFEWSYREAGPALWRVRIGRVDAEALAAGSGGGGCCGGCGCSRG